MYLLILILVFSFIYSFWKCTMQSLCKTLEFSTSNKQNKLNLLLADIMLKVFNAKFYIERTIGYKSSVKFNYKRIISNLKLWLKFKSSTLLKTKSYNVSNSCASSSFKERDRRLEIINSCALLSFKSRWRLVKLTRNF